MADTLDVAAASAGETRMTPKASAPASYLDEVDALRAIAVTVVIIFHCELVHFGWGGVWLFFVISGFAITTSLMNSEIKRPKRGVFIRNFYIRRSLRIWPLYYLYVALLCVVIWLAMKYSLFNHIPWVLTYTQNFNLMFPREYDKSWIPLSILWTLAVEEQFYLLFPFLFTFFGKRGVTLGLFAIIIAAPFIRYALGQWAQAQGWSNDDIGRLVYMFPLAQFDSFAAGCLLALHRETLEKNVKWAWWALVGAVAYVATYTITYLLLFQAENGGGLFSGFRTLFPHHNFGQLREVFVYPAMWLPSAALIWLMIVRQKALIGLARIPGLRAIGRVSFGAYIYHAIVIYFLSEFVPWFDGGGQNMDTVQRVTLFLTTFSITIPLAFLSFHIFEKRISDLRHRFG